MDNYGVIGRSFHGKEISLSLIIALFFSFNQSDKQYSVDRSSMENIFTHHGGNCKNPRANFADFRELREPRETSHGFLVALACVSQGFSVIFNPLLFVACLFFLS